MTVNIQASLSCCIHIVLHCFKIHVSIAIHATGHLHGIACNSLCEVLVGQFIDRRFLKIVWNGSTYTQLEIRILGIVDILLERLVLIEVSIIVIVRFTLFEFLLCHCRDRYTGYQHTH